MIWDLPHKKRSNTAGPQGIADVQTCDKVLDKVVLEDDGDEGGVGDSGADTVEAKDDGEVFYVHRGRRRLLRPRWRC